ncbi:MAG: ATP-binding cassette domain-containing protein [Actinobacteria bacterium]|nr:ATP-binding cassette domain-containing protein [Actinomycetota bacterium]
MIKIENLSRSFEQVRALDDFSVEIKRGELFGLIGPNGAGKSTLMKCLIGLLKPDKGEILIDGENAVENSISVKKRIGYAPEDPVLYDYLTGMEFLEFITDLRKVPREISGEKIKSLLQNFGLEGKANQLIADYSHGMKQKISLAAALIAEPDILLLDEPTNALDPESIFWFKNHLQQLCESGVTIIFSSHILDTVEKICDRVGIIHRGKMVACDTIKALRRKFGGNVSLEDIFMHLISK